MERAAVPSPAPAPVPTFTYGERPETDEPPFTLAETVELRPGVAYHRDPDGQEWPLDLFLPRTRTGAMPAVVYVHGGGSTGGTTQQFWHHAAYLAERGYAGACIRHTFRRLDLPQAAVRWLRRHARELGIDPTRIAAAGSSAGGHLTALLGILNQVEGGISSKAQAVIVQKAGYGARVAGDEAYFRSYDKSLSPYLLATPDTAPTLIIHGEDDPKVLYARAVEYHRRLQELGVRAQLLTEPAASHGFRDKGVYYARVLPAMEGFLAEVL